MRILSACSNGKSRLVITLFLLVVCALASHIIVFGVLSVFLLAGVIRLRSKKEFSRRLLLFLPFIAGIFAVPLFLTPGRIAAYGITYEGIHRGAVLALRAFLAIGYSLVLISSTPVVEIARSLDWITCNKLRLGQTLLVAVRFAELIKSGRGKPLASSLKHAIEKSQEYVDSIE
jgi:energy-coupling factor transporter transmembrane protein EcfT